MCSIHTCSLRRRIGLQPHGSSPQLGAMVAAIASSQGLRDAVLADDTVLRPSQHRAAGRIARLGGCNFHGGGVPDPAWSPRRTSGAHKYTPFVEAWLRVRANTNEAMKRRPKHGTIFGKLGVANREHKQLEPTSPMVHLSQKTLSENRSLVMVSSGNDIQSGFQCVAKTTPSYATAQSGALFLG